MRFLLRIFVAALLCLPLGGLWAALPMPPSRKLPGWMLEAEKRVRAVMAGIPPKELPGTLEIQVWLGESNQIVKVQLRDAQQRDFPHAALSSRLLGVRLPGVPRLMPNGTPYLRFKLQK